MLPKFASAPLPKNQGISQLNVPVQHHDDLVPGSPTFGFEKCLEYGLLSCFTMQQEMASW